MSPLIVGSNSEGSEGRSDRLGLPVGTSDPGTGEAGDLYYKTDTNKIRYHDGTQWNDLTSGGNGGNGNGGNGGGSGTYSINNSLRFNSADSAHLTKSIGNITTFTFSYWMKRHGEARDDTFVTESSTGFFYYVDTDSKIKINTNSGNIFESNGIYRDPSAWYHIVISNTGSHFNLFVNGVRDKTVAVATQLYNGNLLIGRDRTSNPSAHADFNLADIQFVDGLALGPASFGETDTYGCWQPKEFTGTSVNDGTTWSNSSSDPYSVKQGGNASALFAGNLTSGGITLSQSNTNYYVALDGVNITCHKQVSFWSGNGASTATMRINGNDALKVEATSTTVGWWTLDFTGTITKIELGYLGGSGSSNTYYALAVDGQILRDGVTETHAYGSGGFHLDFANGGTDVSPNTNNFTVNNIQSNSDATISSFDGHHDGTNLNATTPVTSITGTGGYSAYAFFSLTNNTGQHTFYHQANNSTSTWFFSDSGHTYQGTHSTQQNNNTLGYRNGGQEYENHLSTHGTFATANGTTSGYVNSPGESDPGGPGGINDGTATGLNTTNAVNIWKFVVDMTNHKVWIDPGTGTYAGGGDPATPSSTATFLIPSGDLKFWSVPYASGNTNTIYGGDDLHKDSPTNGTASEGADPGGSIVGNYATLHPLMNGQTLSNGNLDVVGTSSWQRSISTIAMSTGKWYWEYELTASDEHLIGVGPLDMQMSGNLGAGSPPGSGYGTELGFVNGTGANGSWTNTGASGAGDCIGIAFDADNGNMYVYKNGLTLNGGIASHTGLTDGPYYAVFSLNGNTRSGRVNFGQNKFKYAAPTGYKSLNTANLTDSAVLDSQSVFTVRTYTGNSGDGLSTTKEILTGFSPDMVLIKDRDGTNSFHLFDTVRGPGLRLLPNQDSAAESTANDTLTTFSGSDGFTLNGNNAVNDDGIDYCAWIWDASEANTSPSGGSISSTCRVNATAGISVVSYSGTGTAGTVAHGLGKKPQMIWVKRRNDTTDWEVYAEAEGATKYGKLNKNDVWTAAGGTSRFNDTEPTGTVFSVGDSNNVNNSSGTYIAYCFTSIEGHSRVGSFSGNGANDNVFVWTGFQPKFIMTRYTTTAGDWVILDTSRRVNGEAGGTLTLNENNDEDNYYTSSQVGFSFLSNGFKVRHNGSPMGDSGRTVVYIAFAEDPFKKARAFPCLPPTPGSR